MYWHALTIFSITLLLPVFDDAESSENPNLSVSAENSQFGNHFSGSMIVEVVIDDDRIRDIDERKGEPDVTLNGKSLRMVQAVDGNWYAYFANVEKAKIADSTVGFDGTGLDFGVFCGRHTSDSVFGILLSDSDGFAVPSPSGLDSFSNGKSPFSSCTGSPTGIVNNNNVVRESKSININPNVPAGQIGLDKDAWPLIQLFSFDDVIIEYNPGGLSQKVALFYGEIPNISLSKDRDLYPENSEIFLAIDDFQLNQDPTDEDSWTFDVDSPPSVFYQVFDENGSDSANGGAGIVNLSPFLSSLGFDDNGKLSVSTSSVMELQSNVEQPTTSVFDGTRTFSKILTFVENGPNSGIFDNVDHDDESNLGILDDAPRGRTGTITYNQESMSVLTGSSTASVSLRTDHHHPSLGIAGNLPSLAPGTEFEIVLTDSDQNINSGAKDYLDVFRDSAIIPTMRIGDPVTLEAASDVNFFDLSTTAPNLGNAANSSIPDENSAVLHIDTSTVANGGFAKISLDMGVSASALQSVLIDSSEQNSDGTNWLNYDLRSFENDLAISDFSDTTFTLSFGSIGASSVMIADSGDLNSSQGFLQLDDSDVQDIVRRSGNVYLVINFDSSNDSGSVGTASNEINSQPIIIDFFSFGVKNSEYTNNSIYRFELKETSVNSSTFEGTLEYSVAGKSNLSDPDFIQTIQTIDDDVKFIVVDGLVDDAGITITYSDLDKVGVSILTSSQLDIGTSSGTIVSDSPSYRFGQPVTITVNDPDLNLKNGIVDIYFVVNDPNSAYVDMVGNANGILLEVLIKGIRYKRCTIDGMEHGGLGATGFTLVETGPSTGIFKGVFKMPSQICNKSGTELISSAGGSLDAKYFDSRDSSGNANIFTLSKNKPATSFFTLPQLSTYEIIRPLSGDVKEISLSGNLENHRLGIPLAVTIMYPDGKSQSFVSTLSNGGNYKSIISINEDSPTGLYRIKLSYGNSDVGITSFSVKAPELPKWLKNDAKRWSAGSISDSDFVDSIRFLIDEGLILLPSTFDPSTNREIPHWVKNNAKWWSEDQILDDDFLKSIQYLVKKGIIRI